MSDELLPYYNRELPSFAAWAPSSPRPIRRSPAGCVWGRPADDPHVERLIEAFAS